MKKRILFIVTYLSTGGIIRSLQNFLNKYDSSGYEVDVFSMVHYGVYKGELKNCNLLPRSKWIEASVAHFENRSGMGKIGSLIVKIADKVTGYKVQKYLLKQVGLGLLKQKQYDAVIGFSEGLPTLLVSMLNHPNKIAWIHCDYASYWNLNGKQTELAIYERMQHVVCVSEFTRDSFLNIYPTLKNKTSSIYNIIDDVMMQSMSKMPIDDTFDNNFFNIVSVGRIDPVKRLSIIPELARRVIDAGCNIRWYVIGPKGSESEVNLLNENMKKNDVEGIVILLGEKSNPYPYIAEADLLVNTSISEACPYVINEAKILGVPVICTDFGSAKEFIEYGTNGYYEPIGKVVDRMVYLINNPHEIKKLKDNLSVFKYDNNNILHQIESLL